MRARIWPTRCSGGAGEPTILATSREPLPSPARDLSAGQRCRCPTRCGECQRHRALRGGAALRRAGPRLLPEFALTASARAAWSPNSARTSTAFRWRSSWPRRAFGSLSVEQIAARLDDRFQLLTGGSRTRCRASRRCARRSTGATTCSPSRSVRCCGDCRSSPAASRSRRPRRSRRTGDRRSAVVDLLSQLVARSLVMADTNDAGPRYRLLETTRAYAMEKLVEAGEIDAVRRRHAQYFRESVRARVRRLAVHARSGVARHLSAGARQRSSCARLGARRRRRHCDRRWTMQCVRRGLDGAGALSRGAPAHSRPPSRRSGRRRS